MNAGTDAGQRSRFWREPQFWLLVALTAALYFSRLTELPLCGEEPRRARVACEILDTGDWIVPRQQGQPFLSRPPLGSWPIAWAAQILGECSPLAVRLPTAIATLLTTLLIYAYSRLFLSSWAALSAGLAYATMGQVLQLGRLAETEATFTLLVSGSLLLWHWGYSRGWPAIWTWSLGYLLAGLGTLAKGPQAPVYFCAAAGLYLLWKRDWRYLISWPHAAGIGLFALVMAAWHVPFAMELGWPAVREVWTADVGMRFLDRSWTTFFRHLILFPGEIFVCTLPWSALLPAYVWPSFRRSIGEAKPFVMFLAIALAITFPSCWLVPGAVGRYYMPLYPCFAPLVGLVIERCLAGCPGIVQLGWRTFWGGAAGTIALATVVISLASTGLLLTASPLAQPGVFAVFYGVAGIAATAVAGLAMMSRQRRYGVAAILMLSGFSGLSYIGVVTNAVLRDSENPVELVAAVKQHLPEGESLVSLGPVDHLFAYYYEQPIEYNPLPTQPGEAELEGEYFCFTVFNGDEPKLPFAWEQVAVVSCDRLKHAQYERAVVIGRRVEQTAATTQTSRTSR